MAAPPRMTRKTEHNKRVNRRRFLKTVGLGVVGVGAACIVDTLFIEPEWVEVTELDLHLPHLPKSFVGKRLAQISDLHLSPSVDHAYLRDCIARLNALSPDLVVITGDYVTHGASRNYHIDVIEIVSQIQAPYGAYSCLGNHDYGIVSSRQRIKATLRDHFLDALPKANVNLLRNQAAAVKIGPDKLWIVGLGDLWAHDLDLDAAFANVGPNQCALALLHNPDAASSVAAHPADAILCGHTHGGQVCIPLLGPPILPIRKKRFAAGPFTVNGKSLYVNRGLGRLGRLRFNCRPEITLFTLKA